MSSRTCAITTARACLAESRRRGATAFGWQLLAWARNARLRAAASSEPAQREMFS